MLPKTSRTALFLVKIQRNDGTYGLVGRRRHEKRKPVKSWYIRMDESGNVISEWHEPDYVISSGRNDALYNLVLLPDGQTVVALGYKDEGDGDSQYLWAFNARTSEEIWNASYNEPAEVLFLAYPMLMMME